MSTLIDKYCRFLGQDSKNSSAVISYTFAVVLVLLVAILPLYDYFKVQREAYSQQADLAIWLESRQAQLERVAADVDKRQPSDSEDKRTLLTLLSETAGEHQIVLAQIAQRQTSVNVTLENQSFVAVFNWLRQLTKEYDVAVDEVTMTQVEDDRVNGRLVFLPL